MKNEKIKKLLGEPLCNMCQAFADDFCEANAGQRQKMGIKSQIIRTVMGNCCEWCERMAGPHDYNSEDNTYFKRHAHCRCTIKIQSNKMRREINSVANAQLTDAALPRLIPLKKAKRNGILGIEIDKFVACLEDARTGKLLETEVVEIKNRNILKDYNEGNGWNVNWAKLQKEYDIYAIMLKNDTEIQGLIAISYDNEAKGMYLAWASAAPWNTKEHSNGNKKYKGVGGHLFAIAAEKTLETDPNGWMYGFAKNQKLLKHYVNKLHAQHMPVSHPYQIIVDTRELHELINEYTYEWKKRDNR